MPAFSPKERNEIYSEITSTILAFAPITSTELGEVVDNIAFAISDQIYESYFEIQNALALLSLTTTTGKDLDDVASEFPNLKPRLVATKATGIGSVTDPSITKKSTTVALGGSNDTEVFLNVVNASTFPTNGRALVGVRGSATFEEFVYNGKTGNQLTSTVDTMQFDHGSGEPVVLGTVGDRIYPGSFTVATQATAQTKQKRYDSTGSLTIYDGEAVGTMPIEAQETGIVGNTPSGTIKVFIGTPPFPLAVPSNTAGLTNAQSREMDADLRERIRRERQALSTANIDAVASTLFATSFEGQAIKFVQVTEDPDPSLPSIIYIDDGAGTPPTQTTVVTPITLVFSAAGGERKFRIPLENLPIVTTNAQNATRIFSNVVVKKNGTTLVQGDGAAQYRVQPDNGLIRLGTALVPADTLEIFSITHYTGLMQVANKALYGDRADRANFRGVVGLGSWTQLRASTVSYINVAGNVTLDGSRGINEVSADIKERLQGYINGLGIGATVVRNKILALGFVRGVRDFTLITPSADVVGSEGVLPKTTTGNIVIS